MFVKVRYLREGNENERKVLVTRIIFVLKRLWMRKMHLLDVSQFTYPEFKRFYASYLAEEDPERFVELLIRNLPTVVIDIKRPKTFYHGTLKIPLKESVVKNAYRTYFIQNIKTMERVFYDTGNQHPLGSDTEVKQILEFYGIKGYSK
jgi:hypothetical protein